MTPPRKSILYLSHNGLTEALGRRQVLPYLQGLSNRGWQFTVISFEKKSTASPESIARVADMTRSANIRWIPRRYRNRPPLVSTVLNLLEGWIAGRRLSSTVNLIHARSTVPALMARLVAHSAQIPWIFDVRGLLAEEYVDAAHWRRGGFRYRMTSWVEKELLSSADGVVTLTRTLGEQLRLQVSPHRDMPASVIPCSVDTSVFKPSPSARSRVRSTLGWQHETILVYSGSLGSWYQLNEMLAFFESARQAVPGLRFLVLTPQSAEAEEAVCARGRADVVRVLSLPPDEVPSYLAGCDAGICFLGRHASKRASSPTKYGEYLATGLPVVTNAWTGDAQHLAAEPAWFLVNDFTEAEYRRVAEKLAPLLKVPALLREAARGLAQREFALDTAIDRYDALYRRVIGP
jgi:glycosyltransferase involved in cell wall biosynthesis